ncbi:MAG: TolB-like protein [Flavobacterium sp.]|jgi:TolB-like protein
MDFNKFFLELKRRNIFKVATTYAIAGWLIIQIVTAIDEPLSLPGWFATTIIVLVFIGFPIALIIAWALELTPEGVKKSEGIEASPSIHKSTGKKLNRLLMTVLSLAVVFLVINRVFYAKATNTVNTGTASIAVLPFVDMSPQQDQSYFSDGLSEELLNVLAKVKDLKVAGRTSSFKYKGLNDDLVKIGSELRVDHILEGSVRKFGNSMRITAQLIKVADGFHMWSETYDRAYSAENLFNIQDEISNEVLKELKVKLLGEVAASKTKKVLTKNTEAYEAYLKGLQLSRNKQPKDLEKAIIYFKNAITLDPKFSLAYSHLALAYARLEDFGSLDHQEAISAIMSNAEKAVLLDKTSGTAYLALAHSFEAQRKFDKMKEALKKAYALEPNNPEILVYYGQNAVEENLALQTELAEKAYRIDPLSPTVIEYLSFIYYENKNYLKYREFLEKNVAINPNYIRAHGNVSWSLRFEPYGKLDEAFILAYKDYQQFPEDFDIIVLLIATAMDLSFFDLSDDLIEKMVLLYPENQTTYEIKAINYFNQKEVVNFAKTINKSLLKYNIKKGKYDAIEKRISAYYHLEKTAEALNYLKTYHPIYLSDTISTVPNQNMDGLGFIAAILKHSGGLEQASRLTEIYGNALRSKFEYHGDLKKEKTKLLFSYKDWASLAGDVKLASKIMEEIYFNRKEKGRVYITLHSVITDLISEAPEFKAIEAKISKDIETMRDKAILFLEGEGDWPLHKINE